MNTLNLGSEEVPEGKKKSKNRNLKIALGLAAVILVPTIGSTLAGSITIGTTNSVEFGQGVVTASACDSALLVTPSSVLASGVFNLESITVGLIDPVACSHKYFTVKVLNSSDSPQIIGLASATNCKVYFETTTASTSSNCTISSGTSTTSFTVNPGTTLAASNIAKITLESSSS
jgi:hypothetical protein